MTILAGAMMLMAVLAGGEGQPFVAKDTRVFEMRTYYTLPGRAEALHTRFREHTSALFRKHGMDIIGYWVPVDEAGKPGTTIVYILAYPSVEAQKKAWDAFRNDPEWIKVRTASEVDGKILERIESVNLVATDYSPIR